MMQGARSKVRSLFLFLGAAAFVLICAWIYAGEIMRGDLPFPLILFVSWLPISLITLLRSWRKPDPALLNPTVDWTFQTSRIETLAMLIAAIGFVAAGYGLIGGRLGDGLGVDQAIGWSSFVFFSACAVIGLVMLVRKHPVLTVSRDGIRAPSLGIPLVPWRDVQGVRTRKFLRSLYVALDVCDEQTHLATASARLRRGAAMARRFGLPLFSFAPQMFGTTADELMTAIEVRLRHFGAADAHAIPQHDPKEIK